MADREDGQIEIVKPIESPRRDEERISEDKIIEEESVEFNDMVHVYKDEYHEHYEEKERSSKLLPILIGIATMGAVGYFGFKSLNQSNVAQSQCPDTNISKVEPKREIEQSKPKEPTPYVEELAVKKDSDDIEKSVIALLSAQKIEAQKEKKLEEQKAKEEAKKRKLEEQKAKEEAKKRRLEEEKAKEEAKKRRLEEEKAKEEAKKRRLEEEKAKEEAKKRKLEEEKAKEEAKKRKLEEEKAKEEATKRKLEEEKAKKESISKIEVVKKPNIVNIPKKIAIKYEPIKPIVYTVKRKDTLVDIGKRFYGGDSLGYKRIIRGNYKLRRKHGHIHAGEKIVIPRKDGKKRRRYILIKKGDTLASISKEIYGTKDKILTIVRANRRIRSKRSTLRVGQKVYIPREKI